MESNQFINNYKKESDGDIQDNGYAHTIHYEIAKTMAG